MTSAAWEELKNSLTTVLSPREAFRERLSRRMLVLKRKLFFSEKRQKKRLKTLQMKRYLMKLFYHPLKKLLHQIKRQKKRKAQKTKNEEIVKSKKVKKNVFTVTEIKEEAEKRKAQKTKNE